MTAFRRAEDGQAIVLISAVIAVLLLAVGLAIDAGQLYVNRRAAQTAADSAAWAGAVVLFNGGNTSQATSAANADAAKNGYSSGITVNTPPLSGNAVADPFFVEVSISQAVTPTFFTGPRTLSVRAVAGATRSGTGDAMLVTGSGALGATGSGVQVNSSAVDAISLDVGNITAPYTRVVGNPGFAYNDIGRIIPAATSNASSVADPFYASATVNLPGPPVSSSKAAVDQTCASSTAVPLTPGTYTGGIRVQGSCQVTLTAGVYILMGGGSSLGFQILGSSTVSISGTGGVLIFNTSSSWPGTGTTCGSIDLNTTGSVALRAQTVGSYAGIVIYQDRNCTGSMRLRNSGARTLDGTIYLPNATLNATQTNTLNLNAQPVVLRYSATGVVNLTFDPSKVAGGRVPALIE
jgi:Flp pilus assembly protein TadG